WLSFAVVALLCLVLSQPHATGLWQRWGRIQWAVFVGLLPWLVFWFGQWSLIAPLVNLFAVPWLGFIAVPLLLASLLILPISDGIAQFGLHTTQWTLEWMWLVLERLASLPGVSWQQAQIPLWALAMASLGAILLLLPRGLIPRWLGALWFLPLFIPNTPALPEGAMHFTLLDVGQGLSAVIQTREKSLVFDTGARYGDRFNTGEAVLLPYLHQQGISRVDRLIISHGDNDHIGGARSLIEGIEVVEILTSVPESMPGSRLCQAGESWTWDGIEFRVLHPPARYRHQRHSDNNRSCVLRVSNAAGSILLSADIEAPAELELVRHDDSVLDVDILVAPHHGSKSSSSTAFVEAVSPRWVLFPVGYRNRYRFPHDEVEARYRELGASLLSSADHGAIRFTLAQGRPIQPESYRHNARHYWHRAP
ncbi:MAG: DNA internalization-related competence protein ComEC/Rec2, partial [Gammaproteobacteria bacterium]|nr:DNA internalization-related competence protein ComEC/Rec2 [Gammaproteobacteria bacterium]